MVVDQSRSSSHERGVRKVVSVVRELAIEISNGRRIPAIVRSVIVILGTAC